MTTALILAAVLLWSLPVGVVLAVYAYERCMDALWAADDRWDADDVWQTGWLDGPVTDTPTYEALLMEHMRAGLAQWGREETL